MLLPRIGLIDDHVCVLNRQATLKKAKPSAHLRKLIHIEASNAVEEFEGMNYRSRCERNVRLLHQNSRQAVAHRGRTQVRKDRRSRWTNKNIGSCTASATGRFMQRSIADTDQREDHHHLYRYGDNTQNGPNRPMGKVG